MKLMLSDTEVTISRLLAFISPATNIWLTWHSESYATCPKSKEIDEVRHVDALVAKLWRPSPRTRAQVHVSIHR